MRIIFMLLLATQIQAQINTCDSITYWTDQGQGLSVGIDTSTILNGFDSIDIYWGVCNSSVCYSGSGINSFFGQITTSDTIKVCYNIILYTANTFETCPEYCDSLIYDGGDPKTQALKLVEEVGETCRAILKEDANEMIDGIGDCVVVLTNLAELIGTPIEGCIDKAYNEIKDRKGKMANGTYVKDAK